MLGKISKITAIALAVAVGSAATAQDLQVGANIGNVPWEFQDDTGANVGFEVDLVNAVAEKLGRGVEIVNIPFQGLFSAVQSGRVDIAMSSITITDERLASVTFAQPYYDSDQSLTVAAGGPASMDEMSGKVVGVDTGSTGDMWATEHQAEYGITTINRYEGLAPPCWTSLLAGSTATSLISRPCSITSRTSQN